MSPLDLAIRPLLSALLTLSAREESLTLVQRGGEGYAKLKGRQRALYQRLAAQFGVATTCELARLEARLELAQARARTLYHHSTI